MKHFSSQKAQSPIESTTLGVLSIIALLVMSTYVTRSINAYFKTTEDTLKDSIAEDLLQSERAESPECDCSNEIVGECGGGDCDDSQELVSYTCTPEGCGHRPPWCRTNRPRCCYEEGDCMENGCPNGTKYIRTSCENEPLTYICDKDEECKICCNPQEPMGPWCPMDGETNPACPSSLTAVKDVRYVGNDITDCGAYVPQEVCDAVCTPPLIPAVAEGSELTYAYGCACPPGYHQTTNDDGEIVCEFIYDCQLRGISYYSSDQNSTCLTNYGTQYAMNNYGCVWDNHYCRYNNMECCTLPPEVEIDTSVCTYTPWLTVSTSSAGIFSSLLGINLHVDGVEGEDALLAAGTDPLGITSCPANYVAVGIDYGHGATHGQVADTTNMIYRLECCPLRATRSGAGQNVQVSDCSWTSDYHGGLIADQGCAEFNDDHTYFAVALDMWGYMDGWLGYQGAAHKTKCCRVSVE